MKVVAMTVVALAVLAAPALAMTQDVEAESKGVFTKVTSIVTKYVFPVCAVYCFLYGIIGKGVKRGEWDMAAVCVIAAVALALFPALLKSLFPEAQ